MPHRLIRSGSLLLFAVALVVILLLHQPQTDKRIDQREVAQATQDKNPEKTFWVRFSTDPVAVLTLGLIVVGSAQAGLFVWQLSLIRKSLADTKKTAKAAKRQARLTRDSLIASQRAWIKVGSPRITDDFKLTESFIGSHFIIPIRNVGNTPATHVVVDLWIGFFGNQGFDNASFEAQCNAVSGYRQRLSITLFPNDPFEEYGYPAYSPRSEYDKAIASLNEIGHMHPMLLGCVTYEFSSDDRKMHQTRFVYHLHYPVGLEKSGVVAAEAIGFRAHHFDTAFKAD